MSSIAAPPIATAKLLFIDPSVEDYQILVQGVNPGIQTVVLDGNRDGVVQITEVLQQHPGVESVHILSHGSPGCLYLGNTRLDRESLKLYAGQLYEWFNRSPRPVTSLLLALYGCNVAAGDLGEEFVAELHSITGANIQASTTRVGSAALGGNWDLETSTHSRAISLAFKTEALELYPHTLMTIAPSITDDSEDVIRSTDEDIELTIAGLTVNDPDAGETIEVTLSVTQGNLTLASIDGLSIVKDTGSSITFSGLLDKVNAAIDGLKYTPLENFNGSDSLTISVDDGDQSSAKTISLNVTPVNDAPSIAPSAASVLEGGNVSFAATNFGIEDIDNVDQQVIVKIATLPGKGRLTLNGASLVVGSTFSIDQIPTLAYAHDGTQTIEAGGTSDSFEVTVDDGAGGTIEATPIPIEITPVNQLPLVDASATLFEGESDSLISISISDPDQEEGTPYVIEILSLPVDGDLKFDGTLISQAEIDAGYSIQSNQLNLLTYSHDDNDANNGFPPDDTFNIRVTDDGGGTGLPGSTAVIPVTLDIIRNNDDPILVNNTGALVPVSREITLTTAMLQVSDPDNTTTQITYTLTDLPDEGVLLFNDGTSLQQMALGSSFTQADIDLGRVSFLGGDSPTAILDSFSFNVRDGEVRSYPTIREGGHLSGHVLSRPIDYNLRT